MVRHLAGGSAATRAWLQSVPGLELRERGEFGWIPGKMPDSVQQAFVTKIAGKVIGKGVIKGYTHEWIVNRLQDGLRRITPRAMLWFFSFFAGREAEKRPVGRRAALVSPSDLLIALQQTSQERVSELKEEYPLVKRIEGLRGLEIPLDRDEVVRRLAAPLPGEIEEAPAGGEEILKELSRLGVLRSRDDGHIDVPDIYRYSFEIAPNYAKAWKGFIEGDELP